MNFDKLRKYHGINLNRFDESWHVHHDNNKKGKGTTTTNKNTKEAKNNYK